MCIAESRCAASLHGSVICCAEGGRFILLKTFIYCYLFQISVMIFVDICVFKLYITTYEAHILVTLKTPERKKAMQRPF
jgi:hypothetical protein